MTTSANNTGASVIMKALAMGIPLVLSMYWPIYPIAPDYIGPILRPTMLLVAIVMALCVFDQPLTTAEVQTAKIFGLMWLTILLTSITADDPIKAFEGSLKLFLLQGFGLMLCRAFRHKDAARILGAGMYWCSICITLFVIFVYLKMMGPVLPTYTAVRVLKGVAEKQGIPLNATPATAMLAYLCAACLRPMSRSLQMMGVFVVLVGSILTGSRAALAMPILAMLLVLITAWMNSNTVWRRVLALCMFATGVVALVYVIGFVPSGVLTAATEGRWDLWRAGIGKFTERPLLGWGYLSWKDDLVSRLPGEYQLTNYLAANIVGGYHNQFVAALSEHGLAGITVLLVLYFHSIRSAWKLAFERTLVWSYGKVALFAMFFVLVRANVELDGLFGFAQDPADYATYILLAIVISRLSIEEDNIRMLAEWRHNQSLVSRGNLRVRMRPVSTAPESLTLGEV